MRQTVQCVRSKRQKKEAPPKPLFISLAQWSNAALGKFKLVLSAFLLFYSRDAFYPELQCL